MTHWKSALIGKYAKMDLVDKNQIIENLVNEGYLTEMRDKENNILYRIEKGKDAEGAIMAVFHSVIIDPIKIIEEYEKNDEFS